MLESQKKLTNGFYAILSLPATAMGFALSVQIAALSWILDTQYKLDIHEIGIVWAAGPLAGIIGQVLIGLISDKVWFWGGRRRPFIIIGGILASLMLFALPNIGLIKESIGFLDILAIALTVALTLDLAINISFNPTRSVIADVTPEGVPRTKGYTWMQTISGFFGVLAYVISIVLGNYFLIYFGVFLVAAFSLIPLFFITEPKVLGADLNAAESENSPAITKSKSNIPELLKIYFAHSFSWIGVQTMFVFIFAFIKEKFAAEGTPLDDKSVGQIISTSFAILNTVGFVLPILLLEPLSKRIGRVKTHTLSVAIMGGGYLGVLLFATSPWIMFLFMAVCGVGWAAIVSLPFAIQSEHVDKTRMGFFMGIFNLSVVIPQLFVSLVLGKIIADSGDKSIIFMICAGSLIISAALWTLVKESKPDKNLGNSNNKEVLGGSH
ncbi:MAG: MFS transporter [Ignavibacteriaceae bacterium]|nr:MFS transporter [Ignavibacteriaceae bacterium]